MKDDQGRNIMSDANAAQLIREAVARLERRGTWFYNFWLIFAVIVGFSTGLFVGKFCW
jgi:hypothetical protein